MNLTIRAQLIGGFGLAVALLIAVFGVAFWGMSSMASATDEIIHENVPADIAVRELKVNVLEQTVAYADYAITLDQEDLATINLEIEEIDAKIAALSDLFGNDPESDALIDTFREEYLSFIREGDLFIAAVQASADAAADDQAAPAVQGSPEEPGQGEPVVTADDHDAATTGGGNDSEVVALLHELEAEEAIMIAELNELALFAEGV